MKTTQSRGRPAESWKILRDKKTGHILCVQATEEPSFQNPHRYTVLGNLYDEIDAAQFLEYKSLGIRVDAIEYLKKEHALLESVDKVEEIDINELEEKAKRVRIKSGRDCFGHCYSLEGERNCATCYSDLRPTWDLCSTIRILTLISKRQKEKEQG